MSNSALLNQTTMFPFGDVILLPGVSEWLLPDKWLNCEGKFTQLWIAQTT
jgi:hypothetical protein